MNFLIDSDWLIDFLKGRNQAVKFMSGVDPESIFISVISYGEIYQGILLGKNRTRNERSFSEFVASVAIVDIDSPTMRIFASIRGNLERSGRRLSDMDLLIASTAIRHDLTLVSRNLRHFDRIDGLRLYSPANEPVSES